VGLAHNAQNEASKKSNMLIIYQISVSPAQLRHSDTQGTQNTTDLHREFFSFTTMFNFIDGSCAADGEHEQSLGVTQFQLVPLHHPNPNAFVFSGTFSENQESSVGILPQPLQFEESVPQSGKPTGSRAGTRTKASNRKGKGKGRSTRTVKSLKRVQKVQKSGQNRMARRSTRKPPVKMLHSETTYDDPKFKETNASRLFKWPGMMMQKIFSENAAGKPVHVQLWTEFSGAGTAEVALNSISSACDVLTSETMASADWATNSQMALINNCTDEHQHVFGDIADVCPSSMLEKAKRKVALTVPQHQHATRMFLCMCVCILRIFTSLSFCQIEDFTFHILS